MKRHGGVGSDVGCSSRASALLRDPAFLELADLGDELVLGVNLSEQDPDTIIVASDYGRELRDYVIADRDRVTGALQSRARSRTSMARILDAL